jgi:saposin
MKLLVLATVCLFAVSASAAGMPHPKSPCDLCHRFYPIIQMDGSKGISVVRHECDMKVCAHMGFFRGECEQMLDFELPQLFKVWQSDANATAEEACIKIHVCKHGEAPHNGTTVPQNMPTTPVPVVDDASNLECHLCMDIIGDIEKALADNKTDAEIIHEIERDTCDHLGPLVHQCDAFVEKYVPELIKYLLTDEDPTKACHQIHACSNAERSEHLRLIEQLNSLRH